MTAVLIIGMGSATLAGLVGRFYGVRNRRDLIKAVGELTLLAVMALLGVGILFYFPMEPWAEGVATGFFAVVAYDLLRMIMRLLD